MKNFENPKRKEWKEICKRPLISTENIQKQVSNIIENVAESGDKAVQFYNEKFDSNKNKKIEVSQKKWKKGIDNCPKELKKAIDTAYKNIYSFHKSQEISSKKIETTEGVFCWRKAVGIEKVGLYIPGGTAPLFSTVLMLGIPAKIAKCKEIILCTPAKNGKINPAILYAAKIVGVKKIFAVGGAQAISAMAYGTETIPKTYKIFGPGNQYVTTAKQLVRNYNTEIDMPAGPSELLVFCDENTNAKYMAADLLSQAEHGEDSQVILVSSSKRKTKEVKKEIEKQIQKLSRKEIAKQAILNSKSIYFKSEQKAIDFINEYAPEHLIIAQKEENKIAEKITNAGSIFIGEYTPESAGDYASGTNHTLPTNGYAKISGGVSVDSFTKKITIQKITKYGLKNIGKTIEIMAKNEELEAHKNAVTIRLKNL